MSNYTIYDWPFKWFGAWKEYGKDYSVCPSIRTFIDPEKNKLYPRQLILNYLRDSQKLASSSRINFPHPITGELIDGSITFMTDGLWMWLDDLAEYIEFYDVILPVTFYKHIERNKFNPLKWRGDFTKLEWPV